jgi:hypothetical protein
MKFGGDTLRKNDLKFAEIVFSALKHYLSSRPGLARKITNNKSIDLLYESKEKIIFLSKIFNILSQMRPKIMTKT